MDGRTDGIEIAYTARLAYALACKNVLVFLRATAYMLSADMLSQFRPSVRLSVRPSVTRVDQSKIRNFQPITRRISETVQDRTEVTIND